MNIHFQWENNLIPLALQALEHRHTEEYHFPTDERLLEISYQYCADITKANSKTFYMASGLLPDGKRQSIRALYAFCRVSDDIVDLDGGKADRDGEEVEARLRGWEKQAFHPIHNHHIENIDKYTLVALAWQDVRRRHYVPVLYSEQLVGGVAYDLLNLRYSNFPDLAAYCYGVACTVGLMSMHIIGHTGPEAIPYAIRLGVALQLTNILRDVGEDWRLGRCYLPKDELEAFGLSEDDIEGGQVTEKWREFMRFQIERVRLLYSSALPGIGLLHQDGRFAIGAAAELYRAILSEIELNDYDVFSRRAAISKTNKLLRLPGIWWRARTANYPKINIPSAIPSRGLTIPGLPNARVQR
jgi:15-cis-phytoene synthase